MKIDSSKRLHQDNLKAEIYHQFKIRFKDCGFSLVCEYKLLDCRFDMVAYHNKSLDIICLIEVRRINAKGYPNFLGKKHLKYSRFNKSILYISDFNYIEDFLGLLDKLFMSYQNKEECILTNYQI